MSRRLHRIWLLPLLFLVGQAWALGLGDIRISSALNQPLRAEIELLAATPEELNTHFGIRVRDKHRAIAFYQELGFALLLDVGFEKGHPVIMEHPSGVVLNLLGPSSVEKDENVLMDIDRRFAGYTHIALRITSLPETEAIGNFFREVTLLQSFAARNGR